MDTGVARYGDFELTMPITLTYDELLRYTNDERDKVARLVVPHPTRWTPRAAGGRLPTVGKLIDHIFLVERRHLQRLTGDPCRPTGLSGRTRRRSSTTARRCGASWSSSSRRSDEDEADTIRTFDVREQQWPMTPRKLLFHILLHETRHWAQIALAVRLAGFEPPGDHDLFFSSALR